MSEAKFYGVAHGFKRGVYEDWSEVQKNTDGFPQPSYKKFATREEAEKFVDASKPSNFAYASSEEDASTWYAVSRGKVVGVFIKYDDVKKSIAGYPQAMQKKFSTYDEAKAYVEKFYEGKVDEESVEKKETQGTTVEKKKKKEDKAVVFYAVARGNKTGVFTEWSDCKAATSGFKGAKFKKFDNEEEAKLFAEGKTVKQIAESKRKHGETDEESEEASPPKKSKKTAKA